MSTFMERYIKKHGKTLIWSPTFKLHVVKTLAQRGLTYQEAADQFNIGHKTTVGRWVREYSRQIASEKSIGTMNQQHSPCTNLDATATEQIRQLQQQLKEVELKNIALNALLELAETTYKIPIRKNFGTKQQDC